jgi:hypothetical protein
MACQSGQTSYLRPFLENSIDLGRVVSRLGGEPLMYPANIANARIALRTVFPLDFQYWQFRQLPLCEIHSPIIVRKAIFTLVPCVAVQKPNEPIRKTFFRP